MPNSGAAGQTSKLIVCSTRGVRVIPDHHLVDVFIGVDVDVGKTIQNAVALAPQGRPLLDKALPQDESRLR